MSEWKDDLIACPHCLSNEDLTLIVNGCDTGKEYLIHCQFCGTFTYFDKNDTITELFDKWNNREVEEFKFTDTSIKTCPYCNQNNCLSVNKLEIISGAYKGSIHFNMICSSCGANTQFCDVKTKRHLMILWNTREMEY